MAYRDAVLADAPKVYLELENNTTNTGSAGAMTGAPGSYVAGKVGQAGSFTGTQNLSNTGKATDTFGSPTASTIEAWIKTTSTASTIWIAHIGTSDTYATRLRTYTGGVLIGEVGGGYAIGKTVINDGVWHHVALVRDGRNIIIYVDGVQDAIADYGASGSLSGNFYVGSNNAGSYKFVGQMDEVANYSVALSATRIKAHFDAAAPVVVVNAGYTAEVLGGTGLAVDPVASITRSASISAAALSGSAAIPSASANTNVRRVSVTEDTHANPSSSGTNYGASATLSAIMYFKFPSISLAAGENVANVKLRLVPTTTAAPTTAYVERVTSTWDEMTLTGLNQPSYVRVNTLSNVGITSDVPLEIDVTSVYNSVNYGVLIHFAVQSGRTFYSSENTATAYRPVMVYTIVADTNIAIPAASMGGSALAVSPGIAIGDGYEATPFTATAVSPSPAVTAVKHNSVAVDALPADATMPGGAYASPVAVVADAMTADGAINNAALTLTKGVLHKATSMASTSKVVRPTSVNDQPVIETEGDDRYFARVMALNPIAYFRMRENNGATAVANRVTSTHTPRLIAHNVRFGQFNAPENRASAYLDGTAYFEQEEIYGASAPANAEEFMQATAGGQAPRTIEFSFRTSKRDQFLMAGADTPVGTTGVAGTPRNPTEITMVNGRLSARNYVNGVPRTLFTAFTDLADGQWHSVVIQTIPSGAGGPGVTGIEIWVDGRFEIRRYREDLGFRIPDFIGARPSAVEGWNVGILPMSQYFVGDFSEVAIYANHDITDWDIANNYYAFMGYQPIHAHAMEARGVATQSTGRGNQKRALLLYWNTSREGQAFSSEHPSTAVEFSPLGASNHLFDAERLGYDPQPFNHGPYKVFPKSVVTAGPGRAYYDERTDERRMINLETDVNLNEYDVIFFNDWPDEGHEFDAFRGYFRDFQTQYEGLLNSIRAANDRGVSLHVGHYRLAIDLGIIDRAEWCPSLPDRGIGQFYDYGTAVKFPWNIAGFNMASNTWPPPGGETPNMSVDYLRTKAQYYGDTHTNNRYRVRAVVPGLTDIESHMIQEAAYTTSSLSMDWVDVLYSYKYLHRPNGLQIGDEYIYEGTDLGRLAFRDEQFILRHFYRYYGAWATPPNAVKAGTVVTTFGATEWVGEREVPNPYANYATTIILQPGDNLKGKPVGGKIFVNFTEKATSGPERNYIQEVPATSPETPAQRSWEYSFTRLSRFTQNLSGQGGGTLVDRNGNIISIDLSAGGSTDQSAGLAMTIYRQLYPLRVQPRWEMYARGLVWLAETEDVQPGSNTVRVSAATAQGQASQPQVVAQRDTTVSAQSMNSVGQMLRVEEDTTGEVTVAVLPMTAGGTISGYGKSVMAQAMTANAELVDNLTLVRAETEMVVLYLHGTDVTLFLREEG